MVRVKDRRLESNRRTAARTERSAWLVPLLQLFSWLPFVAVGAIGLARWPSAHSLRAAFVASLAAVIFVIAESFYYTEGVGLAEIVSFMWLHLLCPLVLFPTFVWLLSKRSHNRDDENRASL